MDDIKQILVVSRSTEECKKAFHYGVSLSRTYGASLTILHVDYEPILDWGGFAVPSLAAVESEYRAMRKQTEADIRQMLQAEKAGGMKIDQMVCDGEPVPEVMNIVEERKIDLLIMAAHEEGRIEHAIYGKATHALVRRMPCSIFLVKGE